MYENSKTTISANLSPDRSQTVLVALSIIAGIFAAGTIALLLADKGSGYATLAASLTLVLATFFYWNKGRIDSERNNASPLEIQHSAGITSLKTDSRVLTDPKDIENLLEKIQMVNSRHSLPIPSGTVDDNLIPIENSAEVAAASVQEINGVNAAQKQQLQQMISRKLNSDIEYTP